MRKQTGIPSNYQTALADECFPIKRRNIRDNDAPWFNNKNRKLCNKKKCIYKKEGKSERYLRAKTESDAAILESKKIFFDKILKKTEATKNSKCFYTAVKMLKSRDAPSKWDIRLMFPGEKDEEIAEKVALFFNEIS